MIILNCIEFGLNPDSIKDLFILYCKNELSTLLLNKSKDLTKIIEKYPIDSIKSALNDISIDNKSNLIIPEGTSSSYILREIEFGGADTKPLHILSKVKRKMSVEEENNVL